MVREVTRKRESSAIRDSRGYVRELAKAPTVDRQFIKREVPMATNPDEGLTAGASQLASRMNQFGAQLNQHFGQMADTLGGIANTQQQLEVAKIEEENKNLVLQAKLDHKTNTPWKTQEGAYAFERHRLEMAKQIAEADGGGSGGGSGGRRRRSGGGDGGAGGERGTGSFSVQDAGKAVKAVQAREEADKLSTLRNPQIAAASGAAQKVLMENKLANAFAKAKAADEGVDPALVDVDHQRREEIAGAQKEFQGLPPALQAQALDSFTRGRQRSWEAGAVRDAKAIQDRTRKDFASNTASEFVDGRLETPAQVEAKIQTGAFLYRGANPEFGEAAQTEGAQATIAAITAGAKARIARGDRLALPQYNAIMGSVFAKDPKLAVKALGEVTKAHSEMLAKDATESAKSVREAISLAKQEKEANARLPDGGGRWADTISNLKVAGAYFMSAKDWNHSNFNAKDDVVKYWNAQAEERAGQENLRKAMAFDPTADRAAAVPAAEDFQSKAFRAGNIADVVRVAESTGVVAKTVKQSLNEGIIADTSKMYYTDPDKTKGPGVLFERAWDSLSTMSEPLRQKVLDNQSYAVYDAVRSIHELDPKISVADAKQMVDANMAKISSEDMAKIAKGEYDIGDLLGVDRSKPRVKEQARTALSARIDAVVKDKLGANAVIDKDRLMDVVGKGVAYRHLLSGGREGADFVDRAIAQQLDGVVPVVADANWRDTVQAVPLHSNQSIAKEAAPYWQGATAGILNVHAAEAAKAVPGLIKDDSTTPIAFRDAPDADARKGYVWVTGSGSMGFYANNPVVVAPGSQSFPYEAQVEVNRLGYKVKTLQKQQLTFDKSVPAFKQQIADQNAKLANTGFQWLIEKEDPVAPRYYLAYRPVDQRAVTPSETLVKLTAEQEALGRKIKAGAEKFNSVTPPVVRGDTIRQDRALHQQMLDGMLQDFVNDEQGKADPMIPRSVGVTIEVPKGLDAGEAIDWMRDAYHTKMITSRGGRPLPSKNAEMGDGWNMFEFMKARNGFSQIAVTNTEKTTAAVGTGVNLDAPWAVDWLQNKLGMDPKDVRDLREGIYANKGTKGLPEATAKALSIEAYKQGEKVLRNAEIGVLQELPWESYSTLVALAADDPKNITKDMVKALNSKNWKGVADAILHNKSASGLSAKERQRGLDSSLFLMGFGN